MNKVMDVCIENGIYKATDMEGMARQLALQQQETPLVSGIEIKTLDRSSFKIIPKKTNIEDYKLLLH